MSQPASVLAPLPFELVFDDGIPMDDHLHDLQDHLLMDVVSQVMKERGRTDFFVASDIFVYYSLSQAQDVVEGKPYWRGPDFLFVDRVEPREEPRHGWVSWEEGRRLPDLILEVLSPSTAEIDRTVKKKLYAEVFRTREYFLYDMDTCELEGFRLFGTRYRPLKPDRQGRFHSEVLGLDLGFWQGRWSNEETTWVRLFRPDGRLAPTEAEAASARAEAEKARAGAERAQADAERARAETEKARADAAEAELARLRALLSDRD